MALRAPTSVRFGERENELVEKAVTLLGLKRGEFIRDSAVKAAIAVIKEMKEV